MYRDHRGSTGWVHLSRRAPWAEVGREPAPSGLGAPPWASPMRLGLGTLGWGGFPLALGGKAPPWPPPPIQMGSWPAPPPSQGAYIKGGRAATYSLGRLPPPLQHLSLSYKLGEALPTSRCIHHHAVVLLDLHQPLLPPCWIKKEETSLYRTCVERGGAVRSALGHR